MGKAHEVAVGADARDFDEGIRKGVIKPLEDAERALEDLTDATSDAGREGSRDLERLEDALEDVQRQSDQTGRDIGRNMDDGFDRAKKGADEFKQEANSSAREAAASFDGSAESIADVMQEITANAFGGFGAAGAVAGIAAAAGIGLVTAGFEAADEAARESEERASEWADSYIEAGGRILAASQVVEGARRIIGDPEQYAAAKKNAEDWGVSESVALLAMAGDANALAEARANLAAKGEQLRDTDKRAAAATNESRQALYDLDAQVRDGTASLEALTGDMEAGSKRADVWSESLRLAAERTAGAKTVTDEFGDSITTLPDGKQIYIDAETGAATDNIDAIESKIYGLPDERVIRIRVQDETQRELDRIVGNINRRRASIGVNVYGIGGKQLL